MSIPTKGALCAGSGVSQAWPAAGNEAGNRIRRQCAISVATPRVGKGSLVRCMVLSNEALSAESARPDGVRGCAGCAQNRTLAGPG